MMGGGDVKLAAASPFGSSLSRLQVSVIMSIAGGLLTLIVLLLHKSAETANRGRPPQSRKFRTAWPSRRRAWILAQRFLNQFALICEDDFEDPFGEACSP
jgi:Flp pilus assembly protein protease CpaA